MRLTRLTLLRDKPEAERTMGILLLGTSLVCQTMEPGDADLEAPRVAPGFYILERHGWEPDSGARFSNTWALVGHDVSHFPEPGVRRSAILLHAGNLDEHTRGCILVGMARDRMGDEPALLRSRDAMDRLRDLIGTKPAAITIMEG